MNENAHAGWQFLPYLFLGVAWFVGFVVFHERHGKDATQPRWLNGLQGTFMFSLACSRGLVIVANRLTESWPDFFPFVYVGISVAFFAPMWILSPPQKNVKITSRNALLLFLYLFPMTLLMAVGFRRDDPIVGTRYWVVPVIIVGAALLFAWIFKKEQRKQVLTASLWMVGFVGWAAFATWLAYRIS